MILADKIIELRKKSGWSQEELAEKINVTRQSVSKWESAQSTPDLDKILQLSRVFGVSTDYLLKDELGDVEYVSRDEDEQDRCRKVSMEEANAFLAAKDYTASKIAFATFMCIVSPVLMIFLAGTADVGVIPVNEDKVGFIGLIVMFLIVAAAVAIYIFCGTKTKDFEYLDTQRIETAYGVSGMVREKQARYKDTYNKYNIIGTCLAILSVIPLFAAGLFVETEEQGFYFIAGTCALLIIVAIGVYFFISGGIRYASFEKLLQEGDYTWEKKKKNPMLEAISTAYWVLITAVFLITGLMHNSWAQNWIIWPVAGLVFAAWHTIADAVINKRHK